MFKEFPKALYQGGLIDAEMVIVHNAQEQEDKSAEGFIPFGEQPEPQPKRRGRPPKAE